MQSVCLCMLAAMTDYIQQATLKLKVLNSSPIKRAGHGSDNNNCAEFCPTAHMFAVNGAEHTLNFSVAGTDFGCTAQVRTL